MRNIHVGGAQKVEINFSSSKSKHTCFPTVYKYFSKKLSKKSSLAVCFISFSNFHGDRKSFAKKKKKVKVENVRNFLKGVNDECVFVDRLKRQGRYLKLEVENKYFKWLTNFLSIYIGY